MFVALLLSRDQASRKYSGPDLPSLIQDVILHEFDLSPVDFQLEDDSEWEFPPEILAAYRSPGADSLLAALGYLDEDLLLIICETLDDPAPTVSH